MTGLFIKLNSVQIRSMRFYEPRTGRYITSEPIGLGGGMNTYLYANGNPTNNADEFGLLADGSMAEACYGQPQSTRDYLRQEAEKPLTACKKNALANFALGITPIGSAIGLGLDLAGFEFDFDEPEFSSQDYDAGTQLALIGHISDAHAKEAYQARIARLKSQIERRSKQALKRARAKALGKTLARKGFFRVIGKRLGPIGAAIQFGIDMDKCDRECTK